MINYIIPIPLKFIDLYIHFQTKQPKLGQLPPPPNLSESIANPISC